MERSLVIFWTLAKRNLFTSLYRDVWHGHISDRDCDCEADEQLRRRARSLRSALDELGPTFVKLGQMLSRRPDLIPQAYALELEGLQDQSAPLPFADIKSALKRRCICGERMRRGEHHPLCLHCNLLEAIFEDIDEMPLAVASLAQVHRARFRGEEVVLKILRPGVLDRIDRDLKVLSLFKHAILRVLGMANNLDAQTFFTEYRRRLELEADLTAEALYMERFRDLQREWLNVCSPRVYWGFERSDLLVMEYLPGRPIREAVHLAEAERESLARLLVRNYLNQVLVDNFFHADPHPGNIFSLGDGRIAYLDFGAMGRLDPSTRLRMFELFRAVVTGDADRAATALIRLARGRPGQVDLEVLQLDLERLIQLYRVRGGGRWTDQIIHIAQRHGIRLPRSVIPLIKGLVYVESVALELDPDVPVMDEMETLVRSAASREMKERLSLDLPDLLERYFTLLREMPSIVERQADRESEQP